MTSPVGVVGAGVMGAEIAWLASAAGREVVLVDSVAHAREAATERVAEIAARRVAKDRIDQAEADAIVARVRPEADLYAVGECDVVIEAVTERLDVKQGVFTALGEAADDGALLASNTSGLSISELGTAAGRPERTVGLHFFNPASVMPLVEVIRGSGTGDDAQAEAMAFASSLGKTPVAVRECPGFLVNRILTRAMAAAYRTAEKEMVAPAAADAAVVAMGPAPMGPFALANLVGLDTLSFLLHDLETAYGERFDQGAALPALVTAGRLGAKTGEGFVIDDVDAGDGAPVAAAYYAAALDEASRCREEEIAAPDDIDLAMRLGAGWERGPLSGKDA